LQIKILNPEFIILDEIDSGLDIDAFRMVAKSLSEMKTPENTLIFITHNFNLLDYTDVDEVFVMDK
jgi:Fe-S cluster assembly ATP-binding protein